ncbi:MAG: hypothetical protein KDN20_01520 [Verrucomicrobiae bacterium]|nr:hypothetical protein [Verrucomicrobiae bacterium]
MNTTAPRSDHSLTTPSDDQPPGCHPCDASASEGTPVSLPDSILEIAQEVADAYQVSPTPVATALLAILAAALGSGIRCLRPGLASTSWW